MTLPAEGDAGPNVARGPHRACAFLPLPSLRDVGLPAALTGGRRRRLLRDIEAAVDALNWMHGSAYRPAPRELSAATERKMWGFRSEVRQRIAEAASRWSDVDSAVSERGAVARLLKGRSGYAPAP